MRNNLILYCFRHDDNKHYNELKTIDTNNRKQNHSTNIDNNHMTAVISISVLCGVLAVLIIFAVSQHLSEYFHFSILILKANRIKIQIYLVYLLA